MTSNILYCSQNTDKYLALMLKHNIPYTKESIYDIIQSGRSVAKRM